MATGLKTNNIVAGFGHNVAVFGDIVAGVNGAYQACAPALAISALSLTLHFSLPSAASLSTHASIAAGVGRAFSRVCLSVCLSAL